MAPGLQPPRGGEQWEPEPFGFTNHLVERLQSPSSLWKMVVILVVVVLIPIFTLAFAEVVFGLSSSTAKGFMGI